MMRTINITQPSFGTEIMMLIKISLIAHNKITLLAWCLEWNSKQQFLHLTHSLIIYLTNKLTHSKLDCCLSPLMIALYWNLWRVQMSSMSNSSWTSILVASSSSVTAAALTSSSAAAYSASAFLLLRASSCAFFYISISRRYCLAASVSLGASSTTASSFSAASSSP